MDKQPKVTEAQLNVLLALKNEGPLSRGLIAEYIYPSWGRSFSLERRNQKAAVTRMVTHLIKYGYIKQVSYLTYDITDAGKKVYMDWLLNG